MMVVTQKFCFCAAFKTQLNSWELRAISLEPIFFKIKIAIFLTGGGYFVYMYFLAAPSSQLPA